jgi:hypothetical protein
MVGMPEPMNLFSGSSLLHPPRRRRTNWNKLSRTSGACWTVSILSGSRRAQTQQTLALIASPWFWFREDCRPLGLWHLAEQPAFRPGDLPVQLLPTGLSTFPRGEWWKRALAITHLSKSWSLVLEEISVGRPEQRTVSLPGLLR